MVPLPYADAGRGFGRSSRNGVDAVFGQRGRRRSTRGESGKGRGKRGLVQKKRAVYKGEEGGGKHTKGGRWMAMGRSRERNKTPNKEQ